MRVELLGHGLHVHAVAAICLVFLLIASSNSTCTTPNGTIILENAVWETECGISCPCENSDFTCAHVRCMWPDCEFGDFIFTGLPYCCTGYCPSSPSISPTFSPNSCPSGCWQLCDQDGCTCNCVDIEPPPVGQPIDCDACSKRGRRRP
eukprot:m.164232 g.164232  ORF g.164232 m.164232 type:complete len:149 (-) comp31327_c0_seq3:651-1097(-)